MKLREKGQITIPAPLRKRLNLSEGDSILIEERNGQIILKPLLDPSQAWFWTEEWQEGEREAEKDIEEGRTKGFDDVEDLIEELKRQE